MRQQIVLIITMFIFAVMLTGCVSAFPGPGASTIYVSPTGNDSNDGLTPSTAVQTLILGS